MDLYDAEQRVTRALPKLAAAAHNPALKAAFQDHQRVTQTHLGRLEQVFRAAGYRPKGDPCEGMRGLMAEGQQAIDAAGDPDVKDAALIAAAQRVEHYEIAGYGCAGRSPSAWARRTPPGSSRSRSTRSGRRTRCSPGSPSGASTPGPKPPDDDRHAGRTSYLPCARVSSFRR